MPALVGAPDVTHYWLLRRWLWPDQGSWIAEHPWSTDYQLRLVRNDPLLLWNADADELVNLQSSERALADDEAAGLQVEEDLFVTAEWRGHGVGKRLLIHLARLAVERNCGRFEWAVLDWNEPAIEFYRRLGAQPLHEWTVFRVTGDELHKLAGV